MSLLTFSSPGLAIAAGMAVAVPVAIHLLMRRRRKPVEWAAMELLRANPDKIFWNGVMANQSTEAMRLLAENFDRVDYSSWLILQQNPAIFEEFEVEVEVEVERSKKINSEEVAKIEMLIDDGDIVTPPTTPICSYSDNWEDEDYCTPTI